MTAALAETIFIGALTFLFGSLLLAALGGCFYLWFLLIRASLRRLLGRQ